MVVAGRSSWRRRLAAALTLLSLATVAAPTYLAEIDWPTHGCRQETITALWLSCSLPTGRLSLGTINEYINIIECEADASGRAGGFLCAELRAHDALRSLETRMVHSLIVDGCALREPLACALPLLGAPLATTLEVDSPPHPLRPEHLAGLYNITKLYINKIGVNASRLPYEALGTMPQLKYLSLTGQVQQLTQGWQPTLEHLATLKLEGPIEIPARVIDGLPKLQILHLINTEKLNEKAFLNSSSLQQIYLKSIGLKSLPQNLLRTTPELKMFHLSDHKLEMIPRELFRNLQYLEKVSLSNGHRTGFILEDHAFADLPALQTLMITSCGVTTVPASLLRDSRMLGKLSLRGNQLVELPVELLVEQVALRTLDLGQNRLRTLPRNMFDNTKLLEDIDLSENVIESLPEYVFVYLSALNKLDLSHNMLTQLHSNVFVGLQNMRDLWLSHNKLSLAAAAGARGGRSRSPLSKLYSLRRLALSHNAIRTVMDDWRTNFLQLQTLDLSHNLLEELTDSDVSYFSYVEVDYGSNNISRLHLTEEKIQDSSFKKTKSLFLINNNPLICDCNMFNFTVGLRDPEFAKHFRLDAAHCAAPAPLGGKQLSGVSAAELACTLEAPACPTHCACALRPATARLELDCAVIPRTLPPLAPLHVSTAQLRLRIVPADLAALPPEVRHVDLSGLGLTVAPWSSSRVNNLTIDLSNNNLTIAPISLLKANATVRLVGNRFECDCAHRDSIVALERHWMQLEEGADLQCAGEGRVVGSPASKLCAIRNAIVLGSTLAVVGLVLAAIGALAFRYSTEIRLVLRRYEALDFLFEKPPDPDGLEKEYDAFVSFSHRDDDFVRDELLPRLEGGRQPLRLCLHFRDWEIGGMIPEQIARSVSKSRRTIVVMSREFLESKWGRVEFRAAHGLERVILLLRGDVLQAANADPELRAYLTTNTYVHADDPLVWDRVRDAVLRSRRPRAPAVPAIAAAPSARTLTALPAATRALALPVAVAPTTVLALPNIVTSVNGRTNDTRHERNLVL